MAVNGHDETLRKEVVAAFEEVPIFLRASLRPLPHETGDNTYPTKRTEASLLADLKNLNLKDMGTVAGLIQNKMTGAPVNDREFGMESLLQLACKLDVNSQPSTTLTGMFIDQLWNSMTHPPLSYLGDEYKYRTADGSNNNPLFPHVGKSYTPYARTVNAQPKVSSKINLPDPGVIFDSIMARKDKFDPHPSGFSSFMFYFVSIVIHDLFRTSEKDMNITTTSSYCDLAPLYGSRQEEQDSVRTFKDGLLKPDTFFEIRLLGFPPGVSALLVLLNRFHNVVATQLAVLNEDGRFTKPSDKLPPEKAKLAWAKYDNDLFQTARLIVCAAYMNVILDDYAGVILGLNRVKTSWHLDPRVDIATNMINPEDAARGVGNQVSAEFNLVYRWHSCISARDDIWSQNFYKQLFPGKDPSQVTLPEFVAAVRAFEMQLPSDPSKRTFNNFKRGEDGKFADADLLEVLLSGMEDPAGSFGPNRVPMALKAVEVLGIQQARTWNLATLNEFRQYFGLTKHETFEDVNPDEYVSNQLRHLYDHPDNIELYPGLFIEDAKPAMYPGSGLCAPYTVTRAILSDAVTLVRADRFNTLDYNPKVLTSWGFHAAHNDMNIDHGCVLYKLILNVFPQYFKPNSIYAHYPLVTPENNRAIQKKLGRTSMFTWERPHIGAPDIVIKSHVAAAKIINDLESFNIFGSDQIRLLSDNGRRFHKQVPSLFQGAFIKKFHAKGWKEIVKNFFEKNTRLLLQERSYLLARSYHEVDIIRDIAIPASVRFVATLLLLPVKSVENPRGVYTEEEMFDVLSKLYVYLFTKVDPATSFALHQTCQVLVDKLANILLLNFEAKGLVRHILDLFQKHQKTELSAFSVDLIHDLLDHTDASEVVWYELLPAAATIVIHLSKVLSEAIDFYLSEAGRIHLPSIERLCHVDTPEAHDQILRYLLEGSRIAGTSNVVRFASESVEVVDGGRRVSIQKDATIIIDVNAASYDSGVMTDPEKFSLQRPIESYLHYGGGPHECLGKETTQIALVAMFREIVGLGHLRRAPGPAGQIARVPGPHGAPLYLMPGRAGTLPYPTTMKVNFDGGANGSYI